MAHLILWTFLGDAYCWDDVMSTKRLIFKRFFFYFLQNLVLTEQPGNMQWWINLWAIRDLAHNGAGKISTLVHTRWKTFRPFRQINAEKPFEMKTIKTYAPFSV